jgi:hypothetical protein
MKPNPKPDLRGMREKTLRELEGPAWADPDFPSPMVQRIRVLADVPIREFTVEDLRLVIGQRRGLRYLTPIALEHLEADPFMDGDNYRGDLLMALDRPDDAFWQQHPEWHQRLRIVVEQALARLEAVSPYNPEEFGMGDPDEPDLFDRQHLEPRLRAMLARLQHLGGLTRA